MTRTALLFCAAVLLAVGFGMLTSTTEAVPLGNPGEVCTANGDFGVGHTACVTCLAQGTGAAVCLCKFAEEMGLDDFPNDTHSFGECVASFRFRR